MTKTIYFLRHGQTITNQEGRLTLEDDPLSEHGRQQAALIADRLCQFPLECVVCSTLQRAQETADIVQRQRVLPLTVSDLFVEVRKPSEIKGRPSRDPAVREILDTVWKNNRDPHYRFSDEETWHEQCERGQQALELLQSRSESQILVVTHGAFMNLLLLRMMFGTEMSWEMQVKLGRFFHHTNTGLSICDYSEESGWKLKTWNDRAHLGDAPIIW